MTRFLSDNVAGAHDAVIRAMTACNADDALPYGDDERSQRLDAVFSEVFGKEVAVIPCVSGTAANALSMSLIAGPVSTVFAHVGSHAYNDECNAPEFFTGGARLSPVAGRDGKIDCRTLETAVGRKGDIHAAQPAGISVTQATEAGSVYTLEELAALGEFAHRQDMKMHMDGARFANALVSTGCSAAEMTWKAGVDVLSFGATKNGCVAADAVVLFDVERAQEAWLRAKRAGQLLSKMRFVSAQFLAYLEDDLWLSNARAANAAAKRLYNGLTRVPGVSIPRAPEANMVFARFPDDVSAALDRAGVGGHADDEGYTRLCASWRTTPEDVDDLLRRSGDPLAPDSKDSSLGSGDRP